MPIGNKILGRFPIDYPLSYVRMYKVKNKHRGEKMKYLIEYETKWESDLDWKRQRSFPIDGDSKFHAEQRFRNIFKENVTILPEHPEVWINRVWALDKTE